MSLRLLLVIISAVWAWDVATPVQSLAQTVVWDDEDEVVRIAPARVARPPASDRRVTPSAVTRPTIARRVLRHATARRSPHPNVAVPRPRAELAAATVSSPSEDH